MFYTNNKVLWDFVNNIVEFNINGLVAENVVEAKYQVVPVGGYNKLIDRQIEGVDTMFGVDFFRIGQSGRLWRMKLSSSVE